MAGLKEFIAVAIFIFIFLCDLFYIVETQWYALLFCLLYLLFGVKPSKALAEILSSLRPNSTKTKNNSD